MQFFARKRIPAELLASIKAPVLILHGEDDVVSTLEAGEEWRSALVSGTRNSAIFSLHVADSTSQPTVSERRRRLTSHRRRAPQTPPHGLQRRAVRPSPNFTTQELAGAHLAPSDVFLQSDHTCVLRRPRVRMQTARPHSTYAPPLKYDTRYYVYGWHRECCCQLWGQCQALWPS